MRSAFSVGKVWAKPACARNTASNAVEARQIFNDRRSTCLRSVREDGKLDTAQILTRQRRSAGALRIIGTVYPGVDCPADPNPTVRTDDGPRLVYLGRLIPEKGPDIAVEVATRTGARLDLLGPIRTEDRRFFERLVAMTKDKSAAVRPVAFRALRSIEAARRRGERPCATEEPVTTAANSR